VDVNVFAGRIRCAGMACPSVVIANPLFVMGEFLSPRTHLTAIGEFLMMESGAVMRAGIDLGRSRDFLPRDGPPCMKMRTP